MFFLYLLFATVFLFWLCDSVHLFHFRYCLIATDFDNEIDESCLKDKPPIVIPSLVKCVSSDDVCDDVEGQHQNIEDEELEEKPTMMKLWMIYETGTF
jgi:hypothetical protein